MLVSGLQIEMEVRSSELQWDRKTVLLFWMEAAYYPVILLETRLRFQARACGLSLYPGCVLQLQIEVCFQGSEMVVVPFQMGSWMEAQDMVVVARIRSRNDGRLKNLRVEYVLSQPLLFVYKEMDSPCLGPELKRVLLLKGSFCGLYLRWLRFWLRFWLRCLLRCWLRFGSKLVAVIMGWGWYFSRPGGMSWYWLMT